MDPHELMAEFHRALDIPIGASPALRRVELRCSLIAEEAKGTIEAAERGDLVEAIDGLCDLVGAVYGTALEWGVNLGPFLDEVHRSNMAKAGGPTRADGKKLKPADWTPPDIVGVLREQVAAAAPTLFDRPPERIYDDGGNFNSIIGRSATAGLGG